MNKKISIAIAFFTVSMAICNSAVAQETRKLSLREALELGIQSSKNLKIDQAKIAEANAAIDQAKNNQLPDFKISGSYLRLANANIDLKRAQQQDGEGGGTPKVSQAMYAMANVSLPLYAGGRIRYGIQSAKYLLEAARLNAGNDENAIAYNLTLAYANLFKASQAIKVIEENLVASEQRDSTFIRLENNGIMARNDRLKGQLQTSDIELQLLEAENNFNISNVNMDLMLGLPETTVLEMDSSFIDTVFDDQSFLYYEEKALQNRQDLQAMEYQKKAAALNIKSAKAENIPTIALTGGYVAADIPKVLTVTNAINGGIGLQYNLANLWKSNAVLKQARAKQDQLLASSDLLVDGIRLEVNRDYQNALVAKKKIEVYRKAQSQAEENYRITKNKYDNSLVTITDLLDANAALLSSKINVLNAKADAALANQKLLQTTGLLVQKK